ncbi:MAG: hypothetical protein FJW32_04525 [Acidobacteria bacterium]|nr:hypothetical protein [Acidobacteriota bacterium]
MRQSRRTLLMALSTAPHLRAGAIGVRRDDGVLRVLPPSDFHFLEGQTLRKLQDGAGLVFTMQLSISNDQFRTIARRQVERFVVSFDLWEEKFAAVRLGLVKHQQSHLTRDAAERFLFDHTGIALYGLAAGEPHWIRAELRADEPRDSAGFLLDPSVTLSRLVEWFGRSQRGEALRWSIDRGPFRLHEVER